MKQATILAYQLSLVEAQQSQHRARYFEQRVAGGDYRLFIGKVSHGFDGTMLTEAELRASELATMHRHINMAEDHLEYAKELLAKIRSLE
jgi:hypothetical protein